MNNPAQTNSPLHPLIANRYSTRVFASQPPSAEMVTSLLEAARWAASGGNGQPWRFLVGANGTGDFANIFATLDDGNKIWTQYAPLLIVVIGQVLRNGKPRPLTYYDCGLAVGNLTLQAESMGLRVRNMAGFSGDQLRANFQIPVEFAPIVVLACGFPGASASHLPQEIQQRELAPRERKPLAELMFNPT